MLRKCLALIAIIPAIALTGCKEEGALLTVNKDGSGTLKLRQYVNLAAAGGGFPGGNGGASKPEDKSESTVKAIGKACGVTFKEGKKVKNKMGWPGYEGTFTFADVNKVKITFEPAPVDDDPFGQGGGGGSVSGGGPEFTFTFTPGAVAAFQARANAEDMKGAPGGDSPQAEAQMAAMAPMLVGMRSTIMVHVNGTVTESNAEIPVGKSKNIFCLLDMKMDKIVADKALQADMKKYPDGPPNRTYNTPSLKLQNVTKPTVIKFR